MKHFCSTEKHNISLEYKKEKMSANLQTLQKAGLFTEARNHQEVLNLISQEMNERHELRQQKKVEITNIKQALAEHCESLNLCRISLTCTRGMGKAVSTTCSAKGQALIERSRRLIMQKTRLHTLQRSYLRKLKTILLCCLYIAFSSHDLPANTVMCSHI